MPFINTVLYFLKSIWLLPIFFVYKTKCIKGDKEALKYEEDTKYFKHEGGFFRILYKRPEYISVLYSRLQMSGRVLSILGPRYPFRMNSRIGGGGIYVDHPLIHI